MESPLVSFGVQDSKGCVQCWSCALKEGALELGVLLGTFRKDGSKILRFFQRGENARVDVLREYQVPADLVVEGTYTHILPDLKPTLWSNIRHGHFSDKAFNANGGMLFRTVDGREVTVTCDVDARDDSQGRYVGEIVEFLNYRPSPKWISYDPTYRTFKRE